MFIAAANSLTETSPKNKETKSFKMISKYYQIILNEFNIALALKSKPPAHPSTKKININYKKELNIARSKFCIF